MNQRPISRRQTFIFLFGRNRIFPSGRAVFDGTARKDDSMLAAASAATRRAWH
jgi:hypothetical protein